MEVFDAMTAFFAAGIAKLHIAPDSYGSYMFPPSLTAEQIPALVEEGFIPTVEGLAPAITFALLLGVLRFFLHHAVFKPLAETTLRVKHIPLVAIGDIDAAFPKAAKLAESSQVKAYCARSGRKELDVQRYLWTRRRNRVTNTKIVKYVEAAWRFIFYSSFCALGYYALFVPTTAPWINETLQFFVGWPYHPVSSAVALYYQVELGCYVHQLFWTEVTRSDAFEMILHHLITIALITISFLNNFTRIGSVILLLHDVADVFLEAGKVLNYISKAKGGKWLAPIVDSIFGLFAVSFFVTRLVLYPRYILWSMSTEGYGHFGGGWPVGWSFVVLLFALQFLHIFWFYLIMRMVVKICSTGTVEKDERSDDEDDFDEEEDEFEEVVSSSSSGAEGKKSK